MGVCALVCMGVRARVGVSLHGCVGACPLESSKGACVSLFRKGRRGIESFRSR